MTSMTDGRELDFGKKTAMFNVDHEDGVKALIAFSDSQYRDVTVDPADYAVWAAYGLRSYLKELNLKDSGEFDVKKSGLSNPFAAKVRSGAATSGDSTSPIERALMSVTGKTLGKVRAFLAGKTRKEVNALKALPTIAPAYAAEQAAVLAAAAERKAKKEGTETADLLGGLTDEGDAE